MAVLQSHDRVVSRVQVVSETNLAAEDEEQKIPDDFYYDLDEHIAKPNITEESGLPTDLLKIQYPFLNLHAFFILFSYIA